VIAGSLISMAFSLAVTLFVFFMLRHDNPRFAVELPELVRGAAMFVVLAVLSGIGFLGTVRQARWRHLPLTLTWIGIVMVGWYYWPV
jgi:F0F1-type ATP synthase assembly protein I